MATFPYVTLDVFTTTQFGGNPLAVVTDARGLTGAQMQIIAAEFNYSETTFVLPPKDPANTAQVRIFTRTQEYPFAGHPNVGTAFVLGRQDEVFGKPIGAAMQFEEKAGLVAIDLIREKDADVGARFVAPQSLEVGARLDSSILASCLSLNPVDVIHKNHSPVLASVGLGFFIGEVAPDALSRATPRMDAFAAAVGVGHGDVEGRLPILAYARDSDGVDRLRSRMFAPLGGTIEDPATGSASAALGAFLLSLDPRADANAQISIKQGVDMGRPSEIELDVEKRDGRVVAVGVSGRCVPVMRGELTV
ncbi:MAG: PhzF family phenazine biosynthesis protein [Alphaproteobacteria bacterium]|nr:PhzF family phenazine biosynthesis protein [Alphaproteobacteria bacterium]